MPRTQKLSIETLEGVTYRRTQNHLKPYRSHQETPRREQSNQKHSNMNQTYIRDSNNMKQSCPRIQIKKPVKLNL